jgi:uncharacterized protein YjlB
MDKTQLIQQAYEAEKIFKDDGTFPNNPTLPLLVYKGALLMQPGDDAVAIKKVFEENGWTNSWVAGVYDYHHYHSLTHEVMGVFCGTADLQSADLQLGGPHGVCVELCRGDVVIIPAGVAHKCLKHSNDFTVVGAYPEGKDYDMNYGKEGERPKADENIAAVPLPKKDPVYGDAGMMKETWKSVGS